MAPKMPLEKDSKILIVGAGVFGLSTALHLTKRGYSNIHIFDKQPYNKNSYARSSGCVAASCDENKILRASYGDAKLYQDMAFAAMPEWRSWNEELAATPDGELPPGLKPGVKLWNECGFARLSEEFEHEEKETQANFPERLKGTQYRVSDGRRREEASREGIPTTKIDPFGRLEKKLSTDGVLDMTAGFVLASRSCAFALHLCKKAGVNTYLGPAHGLKSFLESGSRITGITTTSSTQHSGDLIILACGGWTPSLLPQTSKLLETSSGSVLSFRLPHKSTRPDIWSKYSPANFPVWSWNMATYTPFKTVGGIYGLPATPDGIVKVAFRGAKWTDFSRKSGESGQLISYPRTDMNEIPEEAMRVLRSFCAENLPDLLDLEVADVRLCPYTDSVDNNFLISYVPDKESLIVASGGSGHGFKFLPILGYHVVDVLEGKKTEYTDLFAWRDVPKGEKNGLEDGPGGWRTLGKQKMVGRRAWKTGSML